MTIRRLFTEKLPPEPQARFAAAAALGFAPLVTLYQEHGTEVVALGKDYLYPGLEGLMENQARGDALVTNQPGLYIGVKTADCVPVLLWDEEAQVIAAVHAGWRGTAAGIVQAALEVMTGRFGAKPAQIHGAIGPCVCASCYETGPEVPAAMPSVAKPFIKAIDGEKFLVDLAAINTEYLHTAGIRFVEPSPACTACESGRYWSHRRHGNARGLQLSMIGMCP